MKITKERAELLAKEWDVTKNEKPAASYSHGSHYKAYWICEKGHSFRCIIKERTSHNKDCPECKKSGIPLNNIKATQPELMQEWDYSKNAEIGLLPELLTKGIEVKPYWICSYCSASWQGRLANRVRSPFKKGCIPCVAKRKATAAGNNLEARRPEVAALWHPTKNGALTPRDVTPSSNQKVWWKCPDTNEEWEARVQTIPKGGYKKRPAVVKFSVAYPHLVKYWDTELNTVDVTTVLLNSDIKYNWKCEKEHKWLNTPRAMVKKNGCSACKIEEKRARTLAKQRPKKKHVSFLEAIAE